jgi:magnesium and cobalt transporter
MNDDCPSLRSKIFKAIKTFFSKNTTNSLEEIVADAIEKYDTNNKIISMEGKVMLHNVLEFGEIDVDSIMIPRSDIVAVSDKCSLLEIKEKFIEQGHTRMPVYSKSLDNVIGFIHMKDIFPYLGSNDNFHIAKVLRPIIAIPPSMRILDLLVKMRISRTHICLVIDEYGGTDGIVTIEDLVEQIVGDINDEHDEFEEPDINSLGENLYEANSRLSIETLEKTLGINIIDDPNEDCETIGGLIFILFGRIPVKGEKISHKSGIEFEILDAEARQVKKILIKKHKINDAENI